MIDDPLLRERMRLSALVLDALNTIGVAQAALATLPLTDAERETWRELISVSIGLVDAAGGRLLDLGAAPNVPSVGRH